jgi:hypothetical protein
MFNTLANSWSAHYAKLASVSKDDDKLPTKYSLVLPPLTNAQTCRDNLISVPNCVAMLISPSGRVQLLHHTHWDKPTPVYTERSNNLWTLLGVGDSPPVATFNHADLAKPLTAAVPSWESLRDAPDAAAFTALAANTDVTALGLTCNAMVALTPGLAYHLFSANSDDPAKLGTTLARAMSTADHYLSQRGQAPGAIATGNPSVTPVSTPFYEACALLWLASQPNFGHGVAIKILHVSAPVAWSKRLGATRILSAIPGPGPGRGAFSIFSVPPASASGQLASQTEEERVQLELDATEGKGISAAQAVATAKIHHSPIRNTPALQDFLSNKPHINVLVFGRNSPLTTFLRTWSRHTVSHQESYELLTNADASFCSRVSHIIDMAEQAFLCSCITSATTNDIDQSVLDHSALRTGISMGMMPAVAIHASLALILLPLPTPRSRLPAPPNDKSPAKRAKANKDSVRDKLKARDPPRDQPN